MEIEKSKVLIQFLLIFRQSGDVLFFLFARRLRGYTATTGNQVVAPTPIGTDDVTRKSETEDKPSRDALLLVKDCSPWLSAQHRVPEACSTRSRTPEMIERDLHCGINFFQTMKCLVSLLVGSILCFVSLFYTRSQLVR